MSQEHVHTLTQDRSLLDSRRRSHAFATAALWVGLVAMLSLVIVTGPMLFASNFVSDGPNVFALLLWAGALALAIGLYEWRRFTARKLREALGVQGAGT